MGESLPFLRNSYWILRHGKSIPNENGLITCSAHKINLGSGRFLRDRANGTLEEFGLAPEGIHQAKLAGELLNKAMIELRERFFGPLFELLSQDKIWVLDEKDPFTSVEGGESVADVCSRLSIALTALETTYQGCNIMFVSHGDPLQIFQTILHVVKDKTSAEVDISSRIKQVMTHSILSQHRKFALLTAKLRQIK
ncbi:hypothetical protein M5K25_021413 [Dendrobium thyrsiflorum]|uniref:Phosphoglycerate mutase n=1 Tax=Dendrobium thyrsiflorum TaxID=117978 RepID=A0ABD0UD51_DENTH